MREIALKKLILPDNFENMNLAFCLFNYFPYGGLQRDFLRIAQECIARGHTIDVYTMHWEGDLQPYLSVTLLPAKGLQNYTKRKNFVKELQSHLAKKHYDLIVGFNKMPGLDVYYAADTCFQAKAYKKYGFWYRLIPRYRHSVAFEKAVFSSESKTEILLLSKLQLDDFIHYYQTLPDRFHLLPPGISKDRIAPKNAHKIRAELRKEFTIPDDDFLLLMVGSGFKTKGLDRILKGIANLPAYLKNHTHLFVIGKDRPESFQQRARKLGIAEKVKFLGGRDDVPRFLLSADLLLHPAYNENTGTVILEALVSGLPVLTTDVCGYADYVRQADAGYVLPSPFQQNEFDKSLAEMLTSPQRKTWEQNALAFAQQADIYNLPEHAVDLLEAFGSKK